MRSTTTSVLCTLTVLLMLVSTTTRAAPACDANNYICRDGDRVLVGDSTNCYCCRESDMNKCDRARSRCSDNFFSCPGKKKLEIVGDTCQCCDKNTVGCEAPQSNCPALSDERCSECEAGTGRCTSCVNGYWFQNGMCQGCLVPHCTRCEFNDGGRCHDCEYRYRLSRDLKSCVSIDGVLGLQCSYIAAAAATIAMLLALVV